MQLLPVIPRDGQQWVLVLPFTESHGGQPVLVHVSGFPFTPTLDEMGTRIGDLEKNVVELMLQAGMKEQEISQQWLKMKGPQWDHWTNFDLWKPRASPDVPQKPKMFDKAKNWCLQWLCQKFKEP